MKKLFVGALAVAVLGWVGYQFSVSSVSSRAPLPPKLHVSGSTTPPVQASERDNGDGPTLVEPNGGASQLPAIKVVPSDELIDAFPKSVTLQVDGQSYSLENTGQFVRARTLVIFPIQIYSIASYVESPTSAHRDDLLAGLMRDGPRKVYLLRFLRNLKGSLIHTAISEEIEETFSDVDMGKFKMDIERFTSQFANGSTAGDMVYMVWLPGGWLFSSYNKADSLNLIAQDVTLARAVWRIWAGPNAGDDRFQLVRRYTNSDPK